MKKLSLIVAIVLASIIIIAFTHPSSFKLNSGNEKDASENYQMYCAGCHGVNLDQFVNRQWTFGTNPAKIEDIIANGLEANGMPAFGAALSNNEVRALGEFILAESKQKSIDKVASEFDINKTFGTTTKYKIETVVDGLEIPWGLEFLPGNKLLIAERNGTLSVFSKEEGLKRIEGLPEIKTGGQGGLMDLKLHPNYNKNGFIYIAYSYPDAENKNFANTAIIRAKLVENKLTDIKDIYKGSPTLDSRIHFGSKIEFDKKGYLYFSIGERGKRDTYPQKIDNSNGKIHRLFDDGSIPPDNPFVDVANAEKSIFSYGHRNPQGLAIHPITGDLWESEHGPRGGDEINIIKAGANYGWPVISFGINYNGTIFTNDTAKTGMEQPIYYYVPSIAPCGMTFLTGNKYKGWENSLFIGSLRFKYLERCTIENNKVVGHERLLEGIGRVRNVKVSPEGYIYVGVENPGRIIKLIPVTE